MLDVQMIKSAYDDVALVAVRQLTFERLCRAWPQADVLSELNEYQFLLILSHTQTFPAASAVTQTLQTSFAAPITSGEMVIDVELDAATVEIAESDVLFDPLIASVQQRLHAMREAKS